MAGTRTGPRWTAAEDATLAEMAPNHTAAEIAAALPGRTVAGIYQRVRRFAKKRPHWTPGQDLTIDALWGCDLDSIAAKLGRTRRAVYERASVLGLGVGCPVGFEYLTAASVRTGFAVQQLRAILSWAGVRLRHSLIRKRSAGWRWFVSPEAVDAAIASWMRRDEREAA